MLSTPSENEATRLSALQAFQILDTEPEAPFDRITRLAARTFGVPVALVSLIDENRQWFKSCYGSLPVTETDRDIAFCAHAIHHNGVFVVEDATTDPRFWDNPLVTGELGLRFYAGAPLTFGDGLNIGTLCLLDFEPRSFSEDQCGLLTELAACVVEAIEARETSRRLAAEVAQRQQAETRLQAVLDNTTSVIYLKDCEGIYLMVNQSFEQIFKKSRAQILGQSDTSLQSPEAARCVRQNDLEVQAVGRPVEFEETITQADGEHTYISVKFPMRDAEGEIYGICGISTDITERIRTEQALRRSEARKAGILETALDGIVTVDHLGRVLEINPAMLRIFGYTAEQMIGAELAALIIPPDYREAHRHGMSRFLATGAATVLNKRLELPAMRADGSCFTVELTITRIAADGPPMFTGYLRDITERREAEQKLHLAKEEAERANAAKSHFLSRMSHELRTPLNAILGFGQVLQRRAQDEWHAEKTEFIVNAGRHLLDLINEVLDLTRIESGQTNLSMESVELLPLLRECQAMAKTEATKRSIQIEIAPFAEGEGELHARADRQRLKQIFVNLLSNATKYNRESGHIFISAESRADRVAVHFRDTGMGIPAEKMSRLFVPFDRLGAEESDVQGSGIGLSLSKQLAELMGGTLTVKSEVGKGSTFSVTISSCSAVIDEDLSPQDEAARDPLTPQRHQQVVLYAEDNPDNVALMEEIAIEHGGVKLIAVTCGSEVLARAQEVKPRLILLDLHLPKMSGDQILLQLRADPDLQSTPVIMISADAMRGQVERLLKAGANEYLTKPIEVTRALDLFDQYLKS